MQKLKISTGSNKQQKIKLTKTSAAHGKNCDWLKVDGRPQVCLTKFRSQNLPGKIGPGKNNGHKGKLTLLEKNNQQSLMWTNHQSMNQMLLSNIQWKEFIWWKYGNFCVGF